MAGGRRGGEPGWEARWRAGGAVVGGRAQEARALPSRWRARHPGGLSIAQWLAVSPQRLRAQRSNPRSGRCPGAAAQDLARSQRGQHGTTTWPHTATSGPLTPRLSCAMDPFLSVPVRRSGSVSVLRRQFPPHWERGRWLALPGLADGQVLAVRLHRVLPGLADGQIVAHSAGPARPRPRPVAPPSAAPPSPGPPGSRPAQPAAIAALAAGRGRLDSDRGCALLRARGSRRCGSPQVDDPRRVFG